MKRWLLPFLLLLLCPLPAHAATPVLDASLYPAGMKLHMYAHESNDAYLCDWAYDCSSGTPVFHTLTPQDAKRAHGWIQTANRPHLAFALLDSTFKDGTSNGESYAHAYFDDLAQTVTGNGFLAVLPKGGQAALITPPDGGELFMRVTVRHQVLTLYAVWSGLHFIEAVEFHQGTPLARYRITQFLEGQLAADLALDSP